MKFKAEFDMDNAAFKDNAEEVANILRRIAVKVNSLAPKQTDKGLIYDTNGNKIGSWAVSE